ncbi:hypothetical protein L6452_35300 [Arctium lappa]|uniref:Uncharacterized protein n=1 Tax=Arctium lappa TaxID=4217 RepID=A0ACB8YA92_ARCLA|nr:hypothetical protein L6452_35300 [Arctium lappa]
MFLKLFSTKRFNLSARSLHFGKHFKHPNPEDIIFHSICINLRQQKWKSLHQIPPSNLTNSLLIRLISQFRMSPHLILGFYNRVLAQTHFTPSLQSICTLIHVMINCKRYDDALDFINKLLKLMGYSHLEVLDGLWDSYDDDISSPHVFDSLIRVCTSLDDINSAYEVILNLRTEKGFRVSVHAWNNYLNRVLKSDSVSGFFEKYEEMVSYGYVENVYTFNLVVYALCKESRLRDAIGVFYRMLKGGVFPNVVSFNMMIDGACKMGDLDLGLKLFRKMGVMSFGFVRPNSVTFNCIVNGYCKLGDMETAEVVRGEMTKTGIEPNVRMYATLVDGYLRKGCLEEAMGLCSRMVDKDLVPNIVVYNSIIRSLYFNGDTITASVFLSYMIKTNIPFDKFTNSILVNGLSRNGFLKEALDYHKWLVGKNLESKDRFLENTLIYYLVRSGKDSKPMIKEALDEIFNRGFTPDIVTYGTMIDALCKQERLLDAICVYEDMIKTGKKPNLMIYNSIVNGLSKNLSVDLAKIMVDEMKKLGLVDVVSLNTLLNGYFANSKVNEALNLFVQMQEDGGLVNVVSYNIILKFVCEFGSIQDVKDVMETMVARGVSPDSVTYSILVGNACKKCSLEEVMELHDDMVVKGVFLDGQTYDSAFGSFVCEESRDLYSDSIRD